MKTLLIGLGNPILGDDGVGWKVIDEIVNLNLRTDNLEIDRYALGGLTLMERLIGFDRAIIVDALQTGKPIGTVSTIRLEELTNLAAGHTTAIHDTSLMNALEIGRSLGAHLPSEVIVIGVEADRVYDFDESLTPVVAAAVPAAVQAALRCLGAAGGNETNQENPSNDLP